MPRATSRRIVHIECSTPHLYRWFRSQLTYVARDTGDGFEVINETRWQALLAAADGRELVAYLVLRDKGRGSVFLSMRNGTVVGATGSDPSRYVGLTESQARRMARYGTAEGK